VISTVGKRRKRGKHKEKIEQVDPQEMWEKGFTAYEAEDFRTASNHWTPLLDLDDDRKAELGQVGSGLGAWVAEARFRRVCQFYEEGNLGGVLSQIAQVVRLAPDNPVYRYHQGLAYHINGTLDKAEEAYISALSLGTGRPLTLRILYQLAILYLESGDRDKHEAIIQLVTGNNSSGTGCLKKAVGEAAAASVVPGEGDAAAGIERFRWLRLRSFWYVFRGDWESAREEWQKAWALVFGDRDPAGIADWAVLEKAYLTLTTQNGQHRVPDIPGVCDIEALDLPAQFLLGIAAAAAEDGAYDTVLRICNMDRVREECADEARAIMLRVRHALAEKAWEEGKLDEAIRSWQAVMEIDPGDEVANHNYNIARCHQAAQLWEQDDIEAAQQVWLRVLSDGWRDVCVYHNLALSYECQENWRMARRYWEETAAAWKKLWRGDDDAVTNEHLREVYMHISDVYLHEGDENHALAYLERARQYGSDDVELELHAARQYIQTDRLDKARVICEQLLDGEHTATLETVEELSDLLDELDEPEMQRDLWEKYVSAHPGDEDGIEGLVDVSRKVVDSYLEAGDLKAAQAEAERILELKPEQPDALIVMGMAADIHGRCDERNDYMQRAVDAVPVDEKAAIIVKVGSAYLQIGHPRLALKEFHRALRITQNPGLINLCIGTAYEQNGKRRTADRYYEKAIKEFPEPAIAYLAIIIAQRNYGTQLRCYKYAREGADSCPDDLLLQQIACMMAIEMNDIRSAEIYAQRLTRIAIMEEDVGAQLLATQVLAEIHAWRSDMTREAESRYGDAGWDYE